MPYVVDIFHRILPRSRQGRGVMISTKVKDPSGPVSWPRGNSTFDNDKYVEQSDGGVQETDYDIFWYHLSPL